MAPDAHKAIAELLASQEDHVLREWLRQLKEDGTLDSGRIRENEQAVQCTQILRQLRQGAQAGTTDLSNAAYEPLRDTLADLSRSRALQGFTPRETAMLVLSLKEVLFDALARQHPDDAPFLAKATNQVGLLLDRLGLHTMEVFQKSREERHRAPAAGDLGAVDAGRQAVGRRARAAADRHAGQPAHAGGDGEPARPSSQQGAEIAIIDITGVPTVDTLTAQHLLKTVAAARLMGADCIISGIRPQIAQTMVHLGVELNVVSKATLADAFALALATPGRAQS